MSLTLAWPTTLDQYIVNALQAGQVSGRLVGRPDHHIETGLAHVFFYGGRVFKLYKTHDDHTHFIKGVFAPTRARQEFLALDFALNQHFGRDIYREQHAVRWQEPQVYVAEHCPHSIHSLVEMERLDFSHNVHELLLTGQIESDICYELGWQTAELIATYNHTPVPNSVTWYDLASERLTFLEQFIAWLPDDLSRTVQAAGYVEQLRAHLEANRETYAALFGEQLTITLDNHDENLFFADGTLRVIDVLPPMRSWWYGPAYLNLANVMTNVGVLHSPAAAERVRAGYCGYFDYDLPEQPFQFALAFAHLISVAHFGSVPEKRAVAEQYLIATAPVVAALN